MSRYIDADALINALEKRRIVIQRYTTVESALQTQGRIFREEIENAPTIDVAPMEEVERLRAEKEVLEINNKDLKYRNKELTAFNRRWAKECAELQEECDQIKADTVQKMRDRLLEWGYLGYDADDAMKAIREVAEEMLEDST